MSTYTQQTATFPIAWNVTGSGATTNLTAVTTAAPKDLFILLIQVNTVKAITGITSSRMSWNATAAGTIQSSGADYELWWATVNSVGSDTIAVTYTSTVAGDSLAGMYDEWTYPSGYSTPWSVVNAGEVNSFSSTGTTATAPTLESGTNGGLCWDGFISVNGRLGTGSTSGFTYNLGFGGYFSVATNGTLAASNTYTPTAPIYSCE